MSTEFITEDPGTQKLLKLAQKVAGTDMPILITGETGVGKEVLAELVHARSSFNKGPFIPVNCGAIPDALAEFELFGTDRGAFTGAIDKPGYIQRADNGTLFLDEIGELPKEIQVKLLRVLENKYYIRVGGIRHISSNFRLVSATNRDLQAAVQREQFREDLFFRLSNIHLHIAPLRQRTGDISLLAQHFLDVFKRRNKLPNLQIPDVILSDLTKLDWPGNARQLKNAVERGGAITETGIIGLEDMGLKKAFNGEVLFLNSRMKALIVQRIIEIIESPPPTSNGKNSAGLLQHMVDDTQRAAIEIALEHDKGNVARAARTLQISRPTLYSMMQKYDIKAGDYTNGDGGIVDNEMEGATVTQEL